MSKDSTPADTVIFPPKSTVFTDVSWHRDSEFTPVYAVVSAVAEVTGADPIELPPLGDVIDPEALNNLFTSR